MSQKDTEDKFKSTFRSTSTESGDLTKFETTPRNIKTQSSFYTPANKKNPSNNMKDKPKANSPKIQSPYQKKYNYTKREGLRCFCLKCRKNHLQVNEKRNQRFQPNEGNSKYNRSNNKSVINDKRGKLIKKFENIQKRDYSSKSANKKICTCKKRFQMTSSAKINSNYSLNNSLNQSKDVIKILIPIQPNEIDNNYRLEILGTSSEKTKNNKDKKEHPIENIENNKQNKEIIKKVGNYNKIQLDPFASKIRSKIIKINNNEENEESENSEYDVLEKIEKYDELKYKTLVNEKIEIEIQENRNNPIKREKYIFIKKNIKDKGEMKNSIQEDETRNQEEYEEEENEEENSDEIEEENNEEIKRKKIKVYNMNDNKNLDTTEEQDSDSIIIFIGSSVKSQKNDETSNYNTNNIENVNEYQEIGPKNSIRKI